MEKALTIISITMSISVSVTAFLYGLFSLCEWSFNPKEWDGFVSFLFMLLSIMSLILGFVYAGQQV